MGAQTTYIATRNAPSHTPAPIPAPGPSLGPGGNPPRRRAESPSPIMDIQTEMEGRTFKLRSLLADGVRTPYNYKGYICLSYQCRFSCFTNCARRWSHQKLTSKEKTDMCLWVNKNVVTPNVGREDGTSL